jgi:hypothetical protein
MTTIYNGHLTKTVTLLKRVSALSLGAAVSSTGLLSIVDFSNAPLIVSMMGMGI